MQILYVLVRTDIESMCKGKTAAQVAHAANQFQTLDSESEAFFEWAGETTGGFGTTIILNGGPMELISETISDVMEKGFTAGIVHDPGYPIKDGDITHQIPLDTCAFVFGDRDKLEPVLREFELL